MACWRRTGWTSRALRQGRYEEGLRLGEAALAAAEAAEADPAAFSELSYSTLKYAFPLMRRRLRVFLILACLRLGQAERARAHWAALDLSLLDGTQAGMLLRALREGLAFFPEMRPAAESLLDEMKRRERESALEAAPPELREMAERVKTILAACAPGDPAVAELKASPVYQRVAYLIEE